MFSAMMERYLEEQRRLSASRGSPKSPDQPARRGTQAPGPVQYYAREPSDEDMESVQSKQSEPHAAPPSRQTGRRTGRRPTNRKLSLSDVDMESVKSAKYHYDPDDLDLGMARRAHMASAQAFDADSGAITRVRMSATSELKDFTGRDADEDQARGWLSKTKSAFLRDRTSDYEKCLIFGDLMKGPAKHWIQQLSRETRGNWRGLAGAFEEQYCGAGMSAARQYFHSKKRPDETPLEYLHRLNVAGMRADIPVKEDTSRSEAAREHVELFISTLDDRELANQLALLGVKNTTELEVTLRTYLRAKKQGPKAAVGTGRFKSRFNADQGGRPPSTRTARAVRMVARESDATSSEEEYQRSGGESEEEQYRYLFSAEASQPSRLPAGSGQSKSFPARADQDYPRRKCTHCGSIKHDDRSCWKRLTCKKCERKGHPAEHCLFTCKACGEVHEAGLCPMEEFYNLLKKWYVPTKHAGMLPPGAEKMLN